MNVAVMHTRCMGVILFLTLMLIVHAGISDGMVAHFSF